MTFPSSLSYDALVGLQALGDYAGQATPVAGLDELISLLPDPNAGTAGVGGAAANGDRSRVTYLDQMSPAASAALRVELNALRERLVALA